MLDGREKAVVILETREEGLDGWWRGRDEVWCRRRGAMSLSRPIWSAGVR